VPLFDRLADLPLTVDAVTLERQRVEIAAGWARVTTVVVLHGGGLRGEGEDVGYDPAGHDDFPVQAGLEGLRTLAEWSALVDGRELFARPADDAARHYRRWAFEGAALDLALRQAGRSLAEALGRAPRPVRFVISPQLPIEPWLAVDPGIEFKLDAGAGWDRALLEALAAADRVRVVDVKAHYHGDWVGPRPDAALHAAIAEAMPGVLIEDPSLEPDCREALRGAEDRVSFDAPIHSLADLDALPFEPRWLNVKPSRFGSLPRLLECVDACERRGIRMYGGGQFELGPGRRQIETLASLFSPDGPNDVAPGVYNLGGPRAGLPRSPLPAPSGPGF
jgi:hypothetical protein